MRTALMRITLTALLAGTTALGTGTLTASAATGTVVTDSGQGVASRSGNATSFGSVGTQPNGPVEIDCQIYGEPVTGKYGRSLVWDHIPGKGYITDSYVNTGSSGSTAYQGYCEMAAENSYGKTAIWASAKADWNDAVARGVAHRGDLNPPKG